MDRLQTLIQFLENDKTICNYWKLKQASEIEFYRFNEIYKVITLEQSKFEHLTRFLKLWTLNEYIIYKYTPISIKSQIDNDFILLQPINRNCFIYN